ncbi:hypothetical protein [Streptomyces sp. MMS20-AI2-20]|uniref:hypothetical protein n=1 Tax=Streptomyces sp. MMS20-AI2-20 TaxID=2925835 RepID=UPI001F612F84|nr:hypothetical protein [Streptomyces sp. MMS20-AI2-20]MCI4142257.1 hypothetical protein [Streptomyces sp. MMS20-AI2-20]
MAPNLDHTVTNSARVCEKPSGTGPSDPSTPASQHAALALRAHDAWALPVEVLGKALSVTFSEKELTDDHQAWLIALRGRIAVITVPGLSEKVKEQRIRRLFCEHIRHGWAAITVDSEDRVTFVETFLEEVDPAETSLGELDPGDDPPSAPPKRMKDVRDLYEGSAYAPLHGWRSDEEVIAALRTLINDALAGTAEDMPEEVYPLPDGVGAAVTIGYDDQGAPHPLVWVRTDIPSGLRADLWGYCVALSISFGRADTESDENGIYYVGMERSPVTGPGVALLAAVTVQRMGRRPEDCAFPLLVPPAQAEEALPLAA